MKTLINTNTTSQFIVAVNQINNSNTLLPYVLYTKMEELALLTTNPFRKIINSKPSLKKLEILKSAFLNDNLSLKSKVKSLNYNNLQLSVKVYRKTKNGDEIICSACFNFLLKENSFKQVS